MLELNNIEDTTASQIAPLLKWAGGKRWAVGRLKSIFPTDFRCYYEPFFGGGAAFFALRPKKAVISDTNRELIRTYLALQSDWKQVWNRLGRHAKNHSDTYYYRVRSSNPRNEFEVAARLLYLNRTCWNGLYRVNRGGFFNVPRGTKDTVFLVTDQPEIVAQVLRPATILSCDFETSIDRASNGDLIYADPPYTANHNANGFRKYNERMFSWDDQRRLANSLKRARERGAYVVVSNANHKSVRELYSDLGFELRTFYRSSVISSSAESRGRASELLIVGPPRLARCPSSFTS